MPKGLSCRRSNLLEVSLLNGFRDLTLMGVQARVRRQARADCCCCKGSRMFCSEAFDFNHMNNVLVSRDCRKARLIDIDGDSKGSIQPGPLPLRHIFVGWGGSFPKVPLRVHPRVTDTR